MSNEDSDPVIEVKRVGHASGNAADRGLAAFDRQCQNHANGEYRGESRVVVAERDCRRAGKTQDKRPKVHGPASGDAGPLSLDNCRSDAEDDACALVKPPSEQGDDNPKARETDPLAPPPAPTEWAPRDKIAPRR